MSVSASDPETTKQNQYDFSGRHAVVTGGAAGIGLAIAQRLINGGATVSLWDHDAQALEQACATFAKKAPQAIIVDVSAENSVEAALVATRQAAGAIDILVNCAGITGPNTTVSEYPIQDWDKVMNVNLRGPFLCCKAVVAPMRDRGFGRIVNIASVAGKEGNPNASAYSASKAGLIALTKSLGKELAETGVIVNCVTPAAVRTGIFDQMTPQHIDYMLSKIPMKRFGMPDEIAALVAWLCSEECSFTTGATFDISGGRATY